jgi:hypothetical protein
VVFFDGGALGFTSAETTAGAFAAVANPTASGEAEAVLTFGRFCCGDEGWVGCAEATRGTRSVFGLCDGALDGSGVAAPRALCNSSGADGTAGCALLVTASWNAALGATFVTRDAEPLATASRVGCAAE